MMHRNTGQLGGMKKRSLKRKKNSFGTLEERLHGDDVAKRMTSWRACQVGW